MRTTYHPKKLSQALSAMLMLIQLAALTPSAFAEVSDPQGGTQMLMVSAYYSPLPAQRFYMRGSYEADLRLNGYGIHGADGTPVHVGMLAAPRTYAFGTQVRIPGLGVGVVHDRGGAIYAGRSYDRIDVWMGTGEEGLSRALNWGMRLVEGEVLPGMGGDPDIDYSWVSSELPQDTLNRLMARTMLNPEVFAKPITRSSPAQDISDLQEALRMFGYYHGPVSGAYDADTREAIKVFQIDEGVITSEKALGAGNLGSKTLKALKSKIENFNSTVLKEQNRLRGNLASLASGLGKKDEGDKVYKMKQMLWELGYYQGPLNGKYDTATMDAVFEFQKANGVLDSEWEKGAGFYGKKTHEALVAAVDQKIEKLMKYPAEMQVWVPAEIDLPKVDQMTLAATVVPHVSLGFDLKFEPKIQIAKTDKIVAAAKVAPYAFTEDIQLGDNGDTVLQLQKILIQQHLLSKGQDSGTFGDKTFKALVQFQVKHHILATKTSKGAGIAGPKTRAALNRVI
jgi:peptidoglycan hydrolase-like protein with peptidoglycan-binding domain/3D (Asp-Asp-Asp) domain-containing protein